MAATTHAQVSFEIRSIDPVHLPIVIDSNTQVSREDGNVLLYSSAGEPFLNTFDSQFRLIKSEPVPIRNRVASYPLWIESTLRHESGAVYGWYHQERMHVCPNSTLTVPEIGALVSHDNGRSFEDLGVVLTSGAPVNCSARNGYFASGHGDFSVIADRNRQFVYFLFGSYGGDRIEQGVAIARMPYASLAAPTGEVRKYHQGEWNESGIGGKLTPVLTASVSWAEAAADSFWGPSIHWNSHLNQFVMLLNRACCAPQWPQEGIYLSASPDLANPQSWSAPQQILPFGDWYPWLVNMDENAGDEFGKRLRFFSRDKSEFELELDPLPPPASPAPEPPVEPPTEPPQEPAYGTL